MNQPPTPLGTLQVDELDILTAAGPLGRCWERLVIDAPASGIMQSLHWAAFRRRQGLRTLHLGLRRDGELIGGLIGYGVDQPHGLSLLVVPEGPVLPWHDAPLARAGLRALIAASQRPTTSLSSLALRIEPRLERPRPRLLRAFSRAPVDQLATETLYLDLRPPLEAILAGMRPKGRYNIRLAERHGVTVLLDRSPAAGRRLYDVLLAAGQRNGFFVEPADFFTGLIEHLQPAGLAHCLFAERAGATLGALLLITYGRRATYLYGGIANEQRPLMAGYALQWQAIRLARQLGCESYDFFGYEPHGTSDHLYASFSRFKRQFGGQPIRLIGAHDYYSLDRLAEAVLVAVGETHLPSPAPVTALGDESPVIAVVGSGFGWSSGPDQAEEDR